MRFVIYLFIFVASVGAAERPNILWISCEDSSPHFGCYDDPNAVTPNVDSLAKRGLKFRQAWSNAPVCAPARTCIISGRWAPSDGAEHMRSEVPMPTGHKMFPQLLREAGYYCSNNSKEDYNLVKPDGAWDDSSSKAHWRSRKPGQPFFSVFNLLISHESQIRARPHSLVHDPAKVVVPPYMPDTPEVRHDWAQHFDNLTTMDGQLGAILKDLEQDGLSEDTIVFFFADHGTGMPRSKRWPMNSGLQVPLVTYFPEKYQALAPFGYRPGAHTDQLVGFIDLGPTMLKLAGLQTPEYMQGTAFAGLNKPQPRKYNYGFRGRMDERVDCTRSITDGRYVYIRQFMPHLPYGQYIGYMFEMPTTKVWHDMFVQGKLDARQSAFWQPKPTEELYDLIQDPWETKNLIESSEMVTTALELRIALESWLSSTRDLGFIPEAERLAVSAGRSPKDVFADEKTLDFAGVLAAATTASERKLPEIEPLSELVKSTNSLKRYWGLTGILMRGPERAKGILNDIRTCLADPSASVRVAAAEVIMSVGTAEDQQKAWDVLLALSDPKNGTAITSVEALNVIDRLGAKAEVQKDALAKLKLDGLNDSPARYREYPPKLLEHIAGTLGIPMPQAKGAKGAK